MNARLESPHRVIRQIDTGLYLAADGRWVPSEEDAFDFPDLRSALTTCEKMEERHVEMVVVFESDSAGRQRIER